MEKVIGSPRLRLAAKDLGHMLNVALWVGGSAAATKVIELLSSYDFGKYQILAMATVNICAVLAKEFFSDTQEVVEVVPKP